MKGLMKNLIVGDPTNALLFIVALIMLTVAGCIYIQTEIREYTIYGKKVEPYILNWQKEERTSDKQICGDTNIVYNIIREKLK